MKKFLSLLTAILITLSIIPASLAQSTTAAPREELVQKVAAEAANYVASEYGDLDVYKRTDWEATGEELPAAYDLREQGVVPAVRDQGSWGTCWAFSVVGAAETAILSDLGMTVEEYAAANGQELDLSEKHLSWFAAGHLPVDENSTQSGEGMWHNNEETSPNDAHYLSGGCMGFAVSAFANGAGPVTEAACPYTAADGTDSTDADWSLEESARYALALALKDHDILPNPALHDAEGKYVYNAAGTEAIKKALLSGRGVAIAYHADQALAPTTLRKMMKEELLDMGLSNTMSEILSWCAPVLQDLVELFMSEETPEVDDHAAVVATWTLGMDYDAYVALREAHNAANEVTYINTKTYAQYADNNAAEMNHGVVIVGWDDNYAVSNFPADHQPPAPGAWIVRNSWGSAYGNDGYLYLSYYDQTIGIAETFTFVTDAAAAASTDIASYDNMPASGVSSVHMAQPVQMANVFTRDKDGVLTDVSVMTADYDTNVDVQVYLLREGYTSPVDGELLDTVSQTIRYGGYHRIALNKQLEIPAGSVISVVQTQRSVVNGEETSPVTFTCGSGKLASECGMVLYPQSVTDTQSWQKGCIGAGESYVSVAGGWYDWKDIVEDVKASDVHAALAEFDNLSMKAYFAAAETVTQ